VDGSLLPIGIIFCERRLVYWNNGYWFPAYGVMRRRLTNAYDGPIYGYNGLALTKVTVDVQSQLQRARLITMGPVDGILGPMTRDAIAAFQADNGLAVTAAIDEPTLATLGISVTYRSHFGERRDVFYHTRFF